MAAPHVSGVIALMLQARPELTPAEVIDILEGTAAAMPDYEPWEVGAGFVDAHAAVAAAERGEAMEPWTPEPASYVPLGSGSWVGEVLVPGGVFVPERGEHTTIEVEPGADALVAQITWSRSSDTLGMGLFDPDGNLVAQAGSFFQPWTFTYNVGVTNPKAGAWRLHVVGFGNLPTSYAGYWGTYVKSPDEPPEPTTTTIDAFTGTMSFAWDPVCCTTAFTFDVPEGATDVTARIDWADAAQDLDLFVYDPSRRLLGISANDGRTYEEAVAADPMTTMLAPGRWTVEVRGYQVTSPADYSGTFTVTRAEPGPTSTTWRDSYCCRSS